MRITAIHSAAAPIASEIRHAYIDFSKMNASIVAVVTDVIRGGKPVEVKECWDVEQNKPS